MSQLVAVTRGGPEHRIDRCNQLRSPGPPLGSMELAVLPPEIQLNTGIKGV
jgi:hypothetical protein